MPLIRWFGLGVMTVAEGVENAATAARLSESGCDAAQGFHFSRPLGAVALLQLFGASALRQRGILAGGRHGL